HQGGLPDRPVYQREIADLVATIRRRPRPCIAPLRNVATRVREIAGGARNPGTKPRRDLMMSALARARLRRACGHARRAYRPRAKGRRGTWAGARRVRDKRSKSGLTPSTSEGFPPVPSLFLPLRRMSPSQVGLSCVAKATRV